MRRTLAGGLLLVALVTAACGRENPGPRLLTPVAKLAAALHCPATFAHPQHEPVLLVHGTNTTDKLNWSFTYVPALRALDFDVCTVTLPGRSLIDIQTQTEYVVSSVRQIARRSGKLVGIVGASQGALQPRWAVKWWPDVRADVGDLVMLGGANHGTINASSVPPLFCFAACRQVTPNSHFLDALNASDETPGGISYTSVFSTTDTLVRPQIPTSTSALEGATNIRVQNVCPGRHTGHIALTVYDAVGFALVLDALTHPGPADAGRIDKHICALTTWPGMHPERLLTVKQPVTLPAAHVQTEPPLRSYARQ